MLESPAMPRKRIGVVVTRHATLRLRERFPDLADTDLAATSLIHREVLAALHAGRRAVTRPRWVNEESRPKAARSGTSRYVWTVRLERCYVIVRRRSGARAHEFAESWRVLTVLRTAKRGETS